MLASVGRTSICSAISTRSYYKSRIEYGDAIPPQRNHSTSYLRGDAAPFVHRNHLRKQRPFRSAHNGGSRAQRPKRSTRSSAECICGSRQIRRSSTDCVLCRYRPQSLFKLHTSLRKDGSVAALTVFSSAALRPIRFHWLCHFAQTNASQKFIFQ
jgi:hypothetical protein